MVAAGQYPVVAVLLGERITQIVQTRRGSASHVFRFRRAAQVRSSASLSHASGIPNPESKVSGISNLDLRIPE